MSAFISTLSAENKNNLPSIIDVSRSDDMTTPDVLSPENPTLVENISNISYEDKSSTEIVLCGGDEHCDEEIYDADNEPETVCMHCGMFGHVIEDCSMLTGDYDTNHAFYETESVYSEDEYYEEYDDDYDSDRMNKEIEWVRQSSMAANDYYQRTGIKMRNSDFVSKHSGALLLSDLCNNDD
jgi:hypothetical protein